MSGIRFYMRSPWEQWELGFMRDFHPASEIIIWCRIAFAFQRYHRDRGLSLRDDDTERDLIGRLIEVSSGFEPTDEEGRFIWDCYMNPQP